MQWLYSTPVTPPNSTPEFLGITAAASRIGRSEITIRRAIIDGKLTAHREGTRLLIRVAELDAMPKPSSTEGRMTITRTPGSTLLSEG